MTGYTQQANSIMERLPIAEQQKALEYLKKLSKISKTSDTTETNYKLINQRQKGTINSIIEFLNTIEPLADDPLDDILTQGISLRSIEELDNL